MPKLEIQQLPIECGDSLGKLAGMHSEIFDFDQMADNVVKIEQIDKKLFLNRKPEFCPIKKCKMMKEGCKAAYDGDMISLSSNAPWDIVTTDGVVKGWKETVCIECESDFQTIE